MWKQSHWSLCCLHLVSIPGSGHKTTKTSWLGKIEAFTPVWEEGTTPLAIATEMCHLGKGSGPEEQREGTTYKQQSIKVWQEEGRRSHCNMPVCHWKHHACGEGERRVATAAAIPGKQTGSGHFYSTRQGQAHVGMMLSQRINLVSTAMPEMVPPMSPYVPLGPQWAQIPHPGIGAHHSFSGCGGQGASSPKSSRQRATPHSCAGMWIGLYRAGNEMGGGTGCLCREWKRLWINM